MKHFIFLTLVLGLLISPPRVEADTGYLGAHLRQSRCIMYELCEILSCPVLVEKKDPCITQNKAAANYRRTCFMATNNSKIVMRPVYLNKIYHIDPGLRGC